MAGPGHRPWRCDGCMRTMAETLLARAVCTYHWHDFCEDCLPIVKRTDVTDADRPAYHRSMQMAMIATWCWCPMDCDPTDAPESVMALLALRISA